STWGLASIGLAGLGAARLTAFVGDGPTTREGTALIARVLGALEAQRVWLGPGLPEASRAALAARAHQEEGDVALALVEVSAIDADGRCDAPPPPLRAEACWGVAPSTLRFSAAPLAGPRLARIFASDATLSFERDGWRVRAVGLGLSARDLQERSPFGLVAGPDLGPLELLG
ncbi:MAG: hypothetical protein KF901_32775, partial [Myxococcales bacterium]|nr:hypothetical protein [Myxococcales bacterium]